MKILIISDTHGLHDLVPALPPADVFIFAGDMMNSGRYLGELAAFNAWLEKIPVPKERRLLCAGNHDISLDGTHPESSPNKSAKARELLTNGVYLQDQRIEIDGVKFWLSPQSPFFLNWAFNSQRGEDIKTFWDRIPEDTNVLVTHGPPHGILDEVPGSPYNKWVTESVGCEELKKKIATLPNLKLHAFGHIHAPRGLYNDGRVQYVNASFLDDAYRPHKGDGYFLVEI